MQVGQLELFLKNILSSSIIEIFWEILLFIEISFLILSEAPENLSSSILKFLTLSVSISI